MSLQPPKKPVAGYEYLVVSTESIRIDLVCFELVILGSIGLN